MNSKEYSAKTVDEAITKACIDLGMSSDQINIEVVNEGSSGFLGFGSKPAVIRVTRKTGEEKAAAAETEKKPEPAEKPHSETPKSDGEAANPMNPAEKTDRAAASAQAQKAADFAESSGKAENKKAASEKKQENGGKASESAQHRETAKQAKRHNDEPVERSEEEIQSLKDAASGFLSGVFKAMELPVEIKMDYEPEDNVLAINFEGEDMGILIGKRGQTLDSLQYLTSLVVNRASIQFVRVKLDTEDYRRRRKETLENLANNIARKVKKTGRPVSLEPMNPYERRIIHSCLQSNRYVETYSEGTEPYRHVVIAPIR